MTSIAEAEGRNTFTAEEVMQIIVDDLEVHGLAGIPNHRDKAREIAAMANVWTLGHVTSMKRKPDIVVLATETVDDMLRDVATGNGDPEAEAGLLAIGRHADDAVQTVREYFQRQGPSDFERFLEVLASNASP